MRIVSLLPSATEIVCQLGLSDRLVGVTHECDFPTHVASLPRVTQTRIPHDATSGEIDRLVREQVKDDQALYSLKTELLHSLRPELIVTQALCDVCAVAETEVHRAARELDEPARVINLEPTCLEDVFLSIRQVGEAAGAASTEAVTQALRQRVDVVADRSQSLTHRPTVMLLEWIDPPFSSGHWSPELIRLAGGVEVIGQAGQRSRTTSWDEVVAADPEVLVIACCGFDVQRTLQDVPRLQAYPGWSDLRCVQSNRVFVVDGSAYFSRPGPRLVDSLEIVANALHPTVHPLPDGLPAALRV